MKQGNGKSKWSKLGEETIPAESGVERIEWKELSGKELKGQKSRL